MPLSAGSAVGSYVVDSQLGAGGMGEVYRAHDPRLRRDVAIKVISEAMSADPVAVDRFIREALAVSALNHPNIVTIYETGETAGARYIAMELVRGRTLRELVRERMPWARAADIGRQAAEALAVAHAAQIVHRDVKPENVMVRDDGYVKVLDFGLARIERAVGGTAATVSLDTHTGLVIGTIGYMSPEQARGESVTTASDVFSLGIVIYEALTGQHPFPAASPLAVLHAILGDQPVAPSRLVPDLPVAFDEIVLECLQKDQRLRPGRGRGRRPAAAAARVPRRGRRPPHRAAVEHGTASRRPLGRTARPRTRVATGADRQRPARGGRRRSGLRQDRLRRGVPLARRRHRRAGTRGARAMLGAAGGQRGVPAGARGAREPAPERSATAASRA